jgi:hypothetical protein
MRKKTGNPTTPKDKKALLNSYAAIVEGYGASGIALGQSSKEVIKKHGEPIIQSFPPAVRGEKGTVNLTYYRKGIDFTLQDDKVVSIFLYAQQSDMSGNYLKFPGRTTKGLGPGDDRSEVVRLYGKPPKMYGEDHYSYEALGISFRFDAIGRISCITVFSPS